MILEAMEGKRLKLIKSKYSPAILTVLIAVFLCTAGIVYFSFFSSKTQFSNAEVKDQIQSLIGAKKYNEAATLLEKYKFPSEDAEFVCNTSGMINFSRKQYDSAAQAYENCAQLFSNSSKTGFYQNLIGNCYREMGNYNKAIDSYQLAIKNSPFGQTAWVNLINVYLIKGEKAEAAENAKTALKKIPDSQEIKNLLAKTRE